MRAGRSDAPPASTPCPVARISDTVGGRWRCSKRQAGASTGILPPRLEHSVDARCAQCMSASPSAVDQALDLDAASRGDVVGRRRHRRPHRRRRASPRSSVPKIGGFSSVLQYVAASGASAAIERRGIGELPVLVAPRREGPSRAPGRAHRLARRTRPARAAGRGDPGEPRLGRVRPSGSLSPAPAAITPPPRGCPRSRSSRPRARDPGRRIFTIRPSAMMCTTSGAM